MDFQSGAHIRAPSLKRGKNDNGLNERVSSTFLAWISFVLSSFWSLFRWIFLNDWILPQILLDLNSFNVQFSVNKFNWIEWHSVDCEMNVNTNLIDNKNISTFI